MIMHGQGDAVRLGNDWHTPTAAGPAEADGEEAQTPEDGELWPQYGFGYFTHKIYIYIPVL